MATRATIKVEGVNYCKIYKHWDGYPEHMLPWLEVFNKQFTETRGVDPAYKIAQLLRFAAVEADTFDLDSSPTTGWGIESYMQNVGEEYEYELMKDGKVTWKEI